MCIQLHILQSQATDADSGSFGTVEYRLLTASNFTLSSDSGVLTLSRSFDKSSGSKIARLTATASDGEFSEIVAVRVSVVALPWWGVNYTCKFTYRSV